MKYVSTLLFLIIGINANAQAFSFIDTFTDLVKTTDQSPAHWYIEIFNDVGVDTTIRWKALFDPNLPPQWEITFDDQNNFYQPVNDGDSADFNLFGNPAFPQKLIIGAVLNNTPGTASVFFDIYDPADPSYVQQIEYRFIITMGSGTWGTEELSEEEQWFVQSGRTFAFTEEFISNELRVYDMSGKCAHTGEIKSNEVTFDQIKDGVYFLQMQHGNTFYSSRIVLN